MATMRALDLFCCAGGASAGLARAGFEVTGVDLRPQPQYPYHFVQADALDVLAGRVPGVDPASFDLIWASPPCQAYSPLRTRWPGKDYPALIDPVRDALGRLGVPYVIENAARAPLRAPTILCGTMFGLGTSTGELRRHRAFEASFPIAAPGSCRHTKPAIGVYGHTGGVENRRKGQSPRSTVATWREAMGIDWMNRDNLAQSIPPAYAEHVARCLLTPYGPLGTV